MLKLLQGLQSTSSVYDEQDLEKGLSSPSPQSLDASWIGANPSRTPRVVSQKLGEQLVEFFQVADLILGGFLCWWSNAWFDIVYSMPTSNLRMLAIDI